MKKKFSRIFGVGITLVLLTSLMAFAAPVSAGTLSFSAINTPHAIPGAQLLEAAQVDVLVATPDGTTMFAYTNDTGGVLYKSTDAGASWTSTGIGTGLEGETDVVAMAVSPNYATDTTIVAATAQEVFRSSNGGVSFAAVSEALLDIAAYTNVATIEITSIDIATYYIGGQPAILIGTEDTDTNQFGGAYLCRLDTWTWSDLQIGNQAGGNGTTGGEMDVFAVAFSPNHAVDAQILAVGADNVSANLTTKFAANAWGADVLDATIATGLLESEIEYATMAFANDYEWSTMNRVLVGTASSDAALDDVYRVHGGLPGGASLVYDLNVGGTGTDTDVYSIAVDGSIVGATVIVGLQDSNVVKKTADPTASAVSWTSSLKSPIGDTADPDTTVIMSPNFASDSTVYAATDGANSCFSVSTDGGSYFDGVSLIYIGDLNDIDYVDSAIVDANTMFLIMHDDSVTTDGAFTATETQHLFKTTDGGATWTRVLFHRSTATEGLSIVGVSPDYATDNTLYVAQNDTRIWKSTDSGLRFVGLAAPLAVTALTVVDGSTYFTGHVNTIYKSGHWNSATVDDTVVSIAVSPDFANDDTVFLGTNDGDVYYSTGASLSAGVMYTKLGAAQELGVGANIIVLTDPDYANNSTIYAGSSTATEGVNRWVVGTSLTWTQIDDDTDTLITNGIAVADDGTLYAASGTANAGIRRSLTPTGPNAVVRDFESMATLLPTGAKLQNLDYLPGSTVLYAIASECATTTTYPHGWQLLTITDTFAITPTLVAPEEGASTGGTVTFSWEAIAAPPGVLVSYEVETATDDAFANKKDDTATTGTSIILTGFTAGQEYYWRVYVASTATDTLATRKAVRTFTVKVGTPAQDATLSAPAPGATGVSLTPNFQWSAVAGASSYNFQIAEDAGFTVGGWTASDLTNNVYLSEQTLDYSTTYYWRVQAVKGTVAGAWSVGVFTTMAEPEEPAPPVEPPAPTPPVEVTTVEAIPTYLLWVIIAVAIVLVIALIVLIWRTRRAV